MKSVYLLTTVVLLSGCSSNRIILDEQGTDMSMYETHLAECEQYAEQVPTGSEVAKGTVGGAVLGGTLTLISTTPNIVLGGELERLSGGEHSLGMFEFAIVGIPICVVGIAYMALIGTRLLGRRDADDELEKEGFGDRIQRRYQLQKDLFRLTVPSVSELAGQTIEQANLGRDEKTNHFYSSGRRSAAPPYYHENE